MKKFLTLSMLLASIAFAVPSAEAKTNAASKIEAAVQQVRTGYRIRRNGRVVRLVTRTRYVRDGRRLYRETYQTRYLPNGRVTTRVTSRVLVRRY